MPVRQLDGYLAEAGIVRHEPLAALRGARLAVDAPYWLRRLMKRLPPEPLLEATGGLPATLTAAIDKELKAARCAAPHPASARRDPPPHLTRSFTLVHPVQLGGADADVCVSWIEPGQARRPVRPRR